MMNNKGELGLATFIIIIAVVTIVSVIGITAINAGNETYGTSYDTSSITPFNQNESVTQMTDDLNEQFAGTNQTSTTGGSLGDSFNQVYTLGIISSRIVGTVTPGVFYTMFVAASDVLGIPPLFLVMAVAVVAILIIGSLVSLLLGRRF